MKIKVLSAAVSALVFAWLGVSFATQPEMRLDPRLQLQVSAQDVEADHPDSHRLGLVVVEEVTLPEWNETETGAELALLAD